MKQVSSQFSLDHQREHFNAIAHRYHKARNHPNHLLLKQLMWCYFFERNPLPPKRPLRVLEPMCGFCDGKSILEAHVTSDLEYSGFDYSERVVDIVRREMPDLNVWHADATTFQPSKQYDIVLILGGLHHVSSLAAQTIRRLTPAIEPGGWFISLEPTHGNSVTRRIRDRIYANNSLFDQTTEQAFGVDELCEMFCSSGLELRDTIYPGLLSYILYFNPDAFPQLNIGGPRLVRTLFSFDRLFMSKSWSRFLSFATLSLWQKPT